MYKAIVEFYDLADGDRKYSVGDEYPRAGFVVSDERLAELAGNKNKLGKPVIEKTGKVEKVDHEDAEITREKIEKMPFLGLKALATKNGIVTENKKTAELRAEIIEKMNL